MESDGPLGLTEFFGVKIPPKKSKIIGRTPSLEDSVLDTIHLSQVALGPDAKPGRHTVWVEWQGQRSVIGSLTLGSCEQFQVDFPVNCDIKVAHSGDSDVYMTGYTTHHYLPATDSEEEDDDEGGMPNGRLVQLGMDGEGSDEDDEDDEDDEGPGGLPAHDFSDMDDDDEDDSEDDDDEQPPSGAAARLKAAKAAAIAALDQEADDDDEDEDDEDDEDDESEYETDEEAEAAPAPAAAVGGKRAPATPAAQPNKKAAKSTPAATPATAAPSSPRATPGKGGEAAYEAELVKFLKAHGPTKLAVLGSQVKRAPGLPKQKKFLLDRTTVFSVDEQNGLVSLK